MSNSRKIDAMSKIYSYARVSHDDSSKSGVSIFDQLEKAKEYASSVIPGAEFCANFTDEAISGWKLPLSKRPGGSQLIKALSPGDHLICYSIDRLSRNVRDFCNTMNWMIGQNVSVHFIADHINSSTAIGKLQMHMLAAMAQFASDLISERTREALAIKRMQNGATKARQTKKRVWTASEYGISLKPKDERKPGTIHMYQRCSTERQYTSSLGLDAQEAGIRRYAECLSKSVGSKIGDMFSDPAVSAFKVPFAERPAGQRLLEVAKPGDDIVVYRLDRMWRCQSDAVQITKMLKDRGVYLHFVNEGIRTDSSRGEEWIGMLSAMSSLESSFKSRRIRDTMSKCREQGRCVGQINRGFKAASHRGKTMLQLDRKEALELAKVWKMSELGWSKSLINMSVISHECMKSGKPRIELEDIRDASPTKKLVQAENLKNRVAESVWKELLEEAEEEISQPVQQKYWWATWKKKYPYGLV